MYTICSLSGSAIKIQFEEEIDFFMVLCDYISFSSYHVLKY
jgi:hypothetical protein